MDINGITLYPEMNAKIKDILRLGNDPVCLYAAARIEQLEKELEWLEREFEKIAPMNQRIEKEKYIEGSWRNNDE